nr:MAG TPA: hypothetical protein [Caudoviricetes sp.]
MCAPFPHGYTVSRGVPDLCLAMTNSELRARKEEVYGICLQNARA